MNPIIPTVFSADPAAHVWPGDDRLWIYASHDEPGTNTHDTMVSYHVFSSSNLTDWTDHGCVLHLKDVEWAVSHMWAIDAALWKGTYYLVYCAIEKATGLFRTGLATSPRPQGPFKDIGFVEGVEQGQDPALFIDDDDTPYLYWGYGSQCFACQLSDDLRSALPGTTIELTDQLTWVYEGPWVHKYNDKYYLSYPGLRDGTWPEEMFYAIADQPLGPFKFMGEYIPKFDGQAGTNHGSITEYKGKWYAFHHSAWISGMSEVRSLMCDELHYNDDGSIQPIVPSQTGVAAGGSVTIELDAASVEMACGELRGTRVETQRPGTTGAGSVTGFDQPQFGLTFFVQSAAPMQCNLKIRYIAPERDRRNKILVNGFGVDDPRTPDPNGYDKAQLFMRTDEWREHDAGTVQLKEGDNFIRIYAGEGGIEIDRIRLVPETGHLTNP